MQGYTYKSRADAWVCHKCSALVDMPRDHEDAHDELRTALGAWARLMENVGANKAPDEDVHFENPLGGY